MILKDYKSNKRFKEDGLLAFFEDNTIAFMTREEQSGMRENNKKSISQLKMIWKTSQKEKRLK